MTNPEPPYEDYFKPPRVELSDADQRLYEQFYPDEKPRETGPEETQR